ncbi:MAG: hypothetical protein AAB295_01145, partial [Chloroflexota bacterium]
VNTVECAATVAAHFRATRVALVLLAHRMRTGRLPATLGELAPAPLRARGLGSVAVGADVAVRHAHRAWERLADDEREKRSRRNYDRLVRRFGSLGLGA